MIIVLESPLGTPVPADGREPTIGDWVQITKGQHVTKRQYSEPGEHVVTKKLVSLSELAEIMPDGVLVELIDIKNNEAETDAKRAASTRALDAMARGDFVDVYNGKFTAFMTRLANNTSLTGAQALAIVNTLKG